MKLKQILCMIGLMALSLTSPLASFAHDGESHDHHKENSEVAKKSPDEAIKDIKTHMINLKSDLDSGVTKNVHDHCEAINDSADAFVSSAEESKKSRAQGLVNNIKKASNSLHDAADAGKTDEAKKIYTKLDSLVGLLEAQSK